MGSLFYSTVALTAIVALSGSFIYPKLEFAGAFRTISELNNDGCSKVVGLEGCEDIWIDEPTGLAYLPCSSNAARSAWLPAVLHLTPSELPSSGSDDFIALLDLNTKQYSKVRLEGMPKEGPQGVYVHAIDVVASGGDGEGLTVAINNHLPPKADGVGANSVIDLFETELGKDSMKFIGRVKHELIRTPNNIAMVSPRQFYFSNDHKRKVHWSRAFEALYAETSDIIYCDATILSKPDCKVAAGDLIYPNGVAKGPGNLIYSGSSLAGNIRMWERQADHTLFLSEEIIVPRPTDNIHVNPLTGSIYMSTFPNILEFLKASSKEGQAKGHLSPVEVWVVGNDTRGAEEIHYGTKHSVERVFADLGDSVSGTTSAAPWRSQIILTGVWTKDVMVCKIDGGLK